MSYFRLKNKDGLLSEQFEAGCFGFLSDMEDLQHWFSHEYDDGELIPATDEDNFSAAQLETVYYYISSKWWSEEQLQEVRGMLDGPLTAGLSVVMLDNGDYYIEIPAGNIPMDQTVVPGMALRNTLQYTSNTKAYKHFRETFGMTPYQAMIASNIFQYGTKGMGENQEPVYALWESDSSVFCDDLITAEMAMAHIHGKVNPEFWQHHWGEYANGYHSYGDLNDQWTDEEAPEKDGYGYQDIKASTYIYELSTHHNPTNTPIHELDHLSENIAKMLGTVSKTNKKGK